MSESAFSVISGKVRPIFAAIRTVPVPVHAGQPLAQPARPPFITISRQGGAGGKTLGHRLVERLNQIDPGEPPWSAWDRELVEKIAADHHISKTLVESLQDISRTWLQEFLAGFSFASAEESEVRIYRRVAATIRALAQVGRVVIVGQGGVYITRSMPGGIHLRLVAPEPYRIDFMMRNHNMTREAATTHVRETERNRNAFFKRYWPNESLGPESFALTINVAAMDEERMVDCILPLVTQAVGSRRQGIGLRTE